MTRETLSIVAATLLGMMLVLALPQVAEAGDDRLCVADAGPFCEAPDTGLCAGTGGQTCWQCSGSGRHAACTGPEGVCLIKSQETGCGEQSAGTCVRAFVPFPPFVIWLCANTTPTGAECPKRECDY